jgi:acetoin utilization protein AcuB
MQSIKGSKAVATTTVGDYMTSTPHTIGRQQTLALARQMMLTTRIRHLPVLDDGRLVGVLSDRELSMIEGLPGVDPHALTVEEAMLPGTYVVSADAPLGSVAADMAELKVGSAVVLDGERVIGVLTAVDALRALADVLSGRPPAPARRTARAWS